MTRAARSHGPAFADGPGLTPAGVAEAALTFGPGDDLAGRGVRLPPELEAAVPARQQGYLAGRLCAGEALRRLGAPGTRVGRQPDGAPSWPARVVGSITHTRGFAWAAAARAESLSGLGIDAEPPMSAERAGRVAGRLLTEEERLAAAPDWPLALWTTVIFSAKESLFKCLHPAVRRYFDYLDAQIDVTPGDDGLIATLRRDLAPALPAGTRLPGRFRIAPDGGLVLTAVWRHHPAPR